MAEARKHHPPEVKARCRQLLKYGERVELIADKLSVSRSFVKRIRVELQAEAKAKGDDQ